MPANSYDGAVYALTDGSELQPRRSDREFSAGRDKPIAARGELVFLLTDDTPTQLIAVDCATGAERWSTPTAISSGVIVVGEVVVGVGPGNAGAKTRLIAHRADTGVEVWSVPSPDYAGIGVAFLSESSLPTVDKTSLLVNAGQVLERWSFVAD